MAEIVVTEGFVTDVAQVRLASKRNEIRSRAKLLATIPEMGSRALPESIATQFGTDVRKLVVPPFDVIYRYDEQAGVVYLLGLMHQRAAW